MKPSTPPVVPERTTSFKIGPVGVSAGDAMGVPDYTTTPGVREHELHGVNPGSIGTPAPVGVVKNGGPILVGVWWVGFVDPGS